MMAAEDVARLHLIVSGRVQGVFFRRATADQARALGIKGFARNLSDGTVEVMAEGPRRDLELLAAWAHDGPPHARVDSVNAEWGKFRGDFVSFSVR
jgi:acylphosphatase